MGFGTFFLVILYAIACLILIFFILIQSGKGGGLSSLGAASQGISDAFGTTGAERALNKLTTIAAVSYIVLAILITLTISLQTNASKTILPNTGTTTTQPISGAGAPTTPELPGAPGQGQPAAPAQ
ncbi:preprotein translocase subunit SecG [bacterium]|nr:preprotein translocase subunit SecG [bacterium]